MKTYVRPLNKGETFCCPIKEVKKIFKDTNVILNFAYFGRNYSTFAETPDGYYLKNKIKGYVIAASHMAARISNPIISFYVVKDRDFTAEMKEEFIQNHLLKFYQLYEEMQNTQEMQDITKLILVELLNNKLILHETVL